MYSFLFMKFYVTQCWLLIGYHIITYYSGITSMGECNEDVIQLPVHWCNVFLALTHRNIYYRQVMYYIYNDSCIIVFVVEHNI